MMSVSEILMSDEFKNNEAVADAIELLDSTLSYDESSWDSGCLEGWRLDELTDKYNHLSWGCGATKVAIVFGSFVLKSTYSQIATYEDGEYDEETEEYADGDYEYREWEDSDYCWIESRVYEAAVEAGVSQFFAPTFRVGNSDVYIQTRADREVAYTDWRNYLEGSISRYEKRFGCDAFRKLRRELHLNCVPREVFSYWLDTTSYMQLKALGQFLYDHCINDLHNHNIGWFGDKVMLFDYSGYNSGTEDTL